MTLAELYALLKQTGYPVAYHHFVASENNPPPPPPFIVYWVPDEDNYGADTSEALIRSSVVHVELYTDKKDLVAEAKLEAILDSAKIHYRKTEAWIDNQKLFQVVYEFDLIEKLRRC